MLTGLNLFPRTWLRFFFHKKILYKNIEAQISEILRNVPVAEIFFQNIFLNVEDLKNAIKPI